MSYYSDQDAIKFLERIAIALEELADAVSSDGVVQMRDVDREKVYASHLGEKLRPTNPSPSTHKRAGTIEVFEPIKEPKE